jgi:Na+/melibiose symporter-like transporter
MHGMMCGLQREQRPAPHESGPRLEHFQPRADPQRRRSRVAPARRSIMGLGTILLIVLILVLVGSLPAWPYSRGWGYGPSGVVGLLLVILLLLVVFRGI